MATKFIHVGNHKCGSTFIQRQLMPLITEVTPINYDFNNCISSEIDSIVLAPEPYYNQEVVESSILRKLEKIGDVCLSFEGFSGFNEGYCTGSQIDYIPRRLRRIFGATKILLVLRGQKSHLQSHYRRLVRFGLRSDFEFWFKACLPPDQRLNFLKYSPLVESYFKNFGKENVKIILFNELFNKTTLTTFLRWTGLSPACIDKLEFSKKVNESDTWPVFAISRFVNCCFSTKLSHGVNVGYSKELRSYNFGDTN